MTTTSGPTFVALTWIALYTGHLIGDYWAQTGTQARTKKTPGLAGALACARHVAVYTLISLAVVVAVAVICNVPLSPWRTGAGMVVYAVSHYLIDRGPLLEYLVARLNPITGKADLYAIGQVPEGQTPESLATGAHVLDQSAHRLFILAVALIIGA